jgi:hypothetical protein
MLSHLKSPQRIKAGLIHFGISLSSFVLIFLALLGYWYPEPFFSTEGGWLGLKIVAGVDVVLGPLLTLIVFNPEKSRRELTTDIGLIVLVQMTALIWGIHTVYEQRPVAVVYWDDSFMTVPAKALTEQSYPLSNLTTFSKDHPAIIYAEKPTKLDNLKKLLEEMNKNQLPPHQQTWLYRPLKEHFDDIKEYQVNIDELMEKNVIAKLRLTEWLQKNQHQLHDLRYFLLKSKYHNAILFFDPKGQLLGYLDPKE